MREIRWVRFGRRVMRSLPSLMMRVERHGTLFHLVLLALRELSKMGICFIGGLHPEDGSRFVASLPHYLFQDVLA